MTESFVCRSARHRNLPRKFLLEEIPYRDVKYAEDMLYGRDVIEAGYFKVYAARGSVVHSNDMLLSEYKKRMFDETMALRKAGISRRKLSLGAAVKLTVKGTLGDTLRIIRDKGYSWKRKLYWLVINPFFHIEKWRGVYTAYQVDLHDEEQHLKNSLEYQNKR